MRWPWQREGGTRGSDRPRASAPPAPAPMGWAFLPPLQRTLGSLEPVTRPLSFPRELPAWRNPASTAPGLTHIVSPEAPSGIVDGDGRGWATGDPRPRLSRDVDLTLLPPPPVAQRTTRPARPAATPLTSAAPVAGLPAVQPAVVQDATPDPEPVAGEPGSAEQADVPEPDEPGAPSVASAGPTATPSPPAQRSVVADHASSAVRPALPLPPRPTPDPTPATEPVDEPAVEQPPDPGTPAEEGPADVQRAVHRRPAPRRLPAPLRPSERRLRRDPGCPWARR